MWAGSKGGGWDGTDESLPSGTRKTGGRWNPKVVQTTGDWRFPHPMERDHPRKKVGHPPPTVEKEYTSPHSPPHDRTGVLHGIGRDAPIEKERRIGNWTGNETVHAQEHLHGCRGGGDDTPGSVGLTPSWNNHPFHSIRWIHRKVEGDVATSCAPSPSKTKRHVRMQRRGTTCACNETSSVPTQARGTDSMRIGNPFGWWNGACLVLRRRNVLVETNMCPSKPTNDKKRDIRSCPTIPARKAVRNLRQAQTSENAAIPVLARRNDTSRPLVSQPKPTQGPSNAT